jgi:peptidoglycan lytic transglycosylase
LRALVSEVRSPFLALVLAGLSMLSVQVVAQAEPVEATYYGDKYAGKPTASGEPYNPKGFTAAHESLPFGTVVEVCYRGCTRARVNDRMPSGSDPDLDLSLAAAQEIGLTEVGIAVVEAEIVENQPTTAA